MPARLLALAAALLVAAPAAAQQAVPVPMGCKAQFSTGLYGVVTEVHHRRFPVIDEERQAVFAFGVFDHCGCKPELTMPDGTVVKIAGFNRPSSILLAEAFAIRGDLIEQVEAVGTSVPYHSDPGWGR